MNRNHRKQIAIGYILFILLFSLFPFIPSVSALVWNTGVTFNCDNEYYSVTTPLTVDNVSVSTHWFQVNGIGWNLTQPAGTNVYINFSSVVSYPKTATGYIVNWTQQKKLLAPGLTTDYIISGLKSSYDYIFYSNATASTVTTTGAGTYSFSSAITSTNRNYKIYDAGIPAGWYVATTGSDTVGTGTLANPYATLQKAINSSSTGDDIYMRGGTYLPSQTTFVNRSGTALDWYTIQNYNSETVTINGSYANYGDKSINATIMLRGADYVRITGLRINRSRSGGISMYNSPSTCDHIRIDNCTIGNSSCSAIRSYLGNTYLSLENNFLYNNFCNWYGHAAGTLSQEIVSLSGVSYGYIYGNRLWKNRVEQIDMKSGCNWMSVHDNIINTTADGVMRNFWLTGGIGIYVDARGTCHNVSIYNNLIYGNHTAIQISNEGTSGRYENISIYNNIINVTNTTGGKPAPDARIGIYVGCEGTSTSINKDIDIYMNTVNLGTGNKYPCVQVGSTSKPITTSLMRRLNITNNIFTNNNKTSTSWWQYLNTAHIQMEGLASTDGAAYIKFNNNTYNNSFVGTCDPRIDWQEAAYTKTTSTKWGNSPLFTKPEYVSPNPVFNPHLNATSPCIGTATSSLVAATDYDDVARPQEGTYDRGALERIGGGGVIPAAPTATTPGPASSAVDRSDPIPSLNITIEDLNADAMNLYFRSNHTGAWATLSSNLGVFNGTYQSLLPGFVPPGKKWWSVNVTDGAYWTNKTFNFTFIVVAPPTSGITLNAVRANWTTSTSVNITWTKGGNCTNTYVYRSGTGYTLGTVLLYSGTNSYFNDTLLDPTVRYYYTLRPYNSVSLLFGDYHNVSLAETTNTTTTSASSALFRGWLGTDKNIWTNFHYATNPTFTMATSNATSKTEYYETGNDYDADFYDIRWVGQSFTIGTTGISSRYYVYNVSFYMKRFSNPGTLFVYLYEANSSGAGAGLPTGVALASGSMDTSTISSTNYEWRNITMSPYNIKTNTKYAIVARSIGSFPNFMMFAMDSTIPTYVGGKAFKSMDAGATWANYTWPSSDCDFYFRIWGHFPSTSITGLITSNETTTTTGLIDILQSSLTSGQMYWYYEHGNDSNGNMTKGNIRYTLTNPDIPTFLNLVPHFTNNSVQVTWLKGNGANRTLIVTSNTAYPSTIAGGNTSYNGTGTTGWITGISFNTTYYISLFSYTAWADLCRYSSGVHIPWGGVTFIVYNESSPWIQIMADILVTDRNGNHPIQFNSVYGYYSFNISQIPYGEDTIFYVSNSSYQSRQYPIDIIPNIFYNFSFYLPPLHPPGWNTTTGNTTGPYTIQVINEQNLPVDGASLKIYRYFNTTGNYTYIGGFVTDGYGMGSISLFPFDLYKVTITCDGYQDKIDWWEPTLVEQTISPSKIFKIYYEIPTNETTYDFIEQIHITATLNNATGLLTVTYLDDMAGTLNLQIYVYDVTNGTLMLTDSTVLDSNVITSVTVNTTHDYEVVYKMNHTYFDYRSGILYITGWHATKTTQSKFDLLFTINFGYNPFGWSNVICWFIMVGCFFSFGRRDSYMIMFLAGFLMLFINYYIGFNTVMSIAAGGAIPIMMIFFGILMLIRDRYRFGIDQ